jgi:hypothetical protein
MDDFSPFPISSSNLTANKRKKIIPYRNNRHNIQPKTSENSNGRNIEPPKRKQQGTYIFSWEGQQK